MKSKLAGLGFILGALFAFNAVAADQSTRGTLRDGSGYERQLKESGVRGLDSMGGDRSVVQARQERRKEMREARRMRHEQRQERRQEHKEHQHAAQ